MTRIEPMTGDELRDARLALNLSYGALADALGMSAGGDRKLRRMEAGGEPVTGPISTAVRLMVRFRHVPGWDD